MPARATGAEDQPEGVATIAEVIGANIRAHRSMQGIDQKRLAADMNLIGHPWHRATVSEVERGRRNVTVAELLALTVLLHVPVLWLLDPCGPTGSWGRRALEISLDPGSHQARVTVSPDDLSALICDHAAGAEVDTGRRWLVKFTFEPGPSL